MKKWCQVALLFLPCLLANGEELFASSSLQIYDRHGAIMRSFLSNQQTQTQPISLSEMSPWLLAAAVSAEDKRFFSHSGVDFISVVRATWQNTKERKIASGASTITQQVARAKEPHPKNWSGKFKEVLQAHKTEQNQTKEEILETYLNIVEFGNLMQGVEAASLFYFGVQAKDVSVAQAAFLVGLIKSPTHYNPLKYFSRALKRQKYVLKRMREEKFLDEEMYALATQEKIELRTTNRPFDAPHFTQLIKNLVTSDTVQVVSSLDRDLQLQTETIIKNQLKNLSEQNVTNAAVVVIENNTGEILAYVGSANFQDQEHQGQVDGVRALRQPGSALKPFVYGLAFEQGILTPGSLVEDEDTFFEGGFRPHNYDESFHGLVPARRALACSYNVPAVKVAEQVGVANLLMLLRKAGLKSLTKDAGFYGLGLSLGNGEVRLLELTNAYAMLARGGYYRPLVVAREPYLVFSEGAHQVFSSQTAYLLTDILKDNQARSAAFGLNSSLSVPFEMAAKTGTSKDYKDNFAFGYTARWTIGVWVGNFDASSMQKVSGITGAGPILHDVAIYLQEKYPSEPFTEPEGLIRKPICTQSGLLAGPTCKQTREEIFIKNKLPATCNGKHASLPQKLRLLTPKEQDVYKWDPAVPSGSQRLKWEADCVVSRCEWKLDGKKYPTTACKVFWPIVPGKHSLSVACNGQEAHTTFEVLP